MVKDGLFRRSGPAKVLIAREFSVLCYLMAHPPHAPAALPPDLRRVKKIQVW
jgi:hypothetical protein